MLGGSSSINGLLYLRGQPEDFDHWRQLGNAGWSFDDVLPYFRAPRTRSAARTSCTASAGRSRSPMSASRIRCARPSSRPRSRPAIRATTTSTARRRKAPAISSSRRATACAARPRSAICSRRGAAQLGSSPTRWRRASCSRAAARPASNIAGASDDPHRARRPRGDPLRRRVQLAAAAAALRRRPGGAAAALGIDGGRRHAGVGDDLQDHLQVRMPIAAPSRSP